MVKGAYKRFKDKSFGRSPEYSKLSSRIKTVDDAKLVYDLVLKKIERDPDFLDKIKKYIRIKKKGFSDYVVELPGIAHMGIEPLGEMMFLHDLVVGSYRRSGLWHKGIGKAMFDKAVAFAKEKGKKEVRFKCGEVLVPMYEKWGAKVYFVDDEYHVVSMSYKVS